MLCITAQNESPTELANALMRAIGVAEEKKIPFLVEFRFDGLRETNETFLNLAWRYSGNAIFCMRSRAAGGLFNGNPDEQIAALLPFMELRPKYVDVGPDVFYSQPDVRTKLRFQEGTKLIVSTHSFRGNWREFELEVAQLAASDADVVKGAIALSDACENLRLLNLSRTLTKPHVLVGMGEAGLLSRARYRSFGSLWTYVAASKNLATAPGQFTIEAAVEMGLPKSADCPFVALLGGAAVKNSPGQRVYNNIFRKKCLPWSYIPVATNEPLTTIDAIRELGARGASVTIPHKTVVASAFQSQNLFRDVGAANTLRFDSGGVELNNTDVAGFEIPLRRAHVTRGERCLILGAGGVSHAAVVACHNLGLEPIICARDVAQARQHFPNTIVEEWTKRHLIEAEILINATSLGGRSVEVWPTSDSLKKLVVFDCALAREPSSLLEKAKLEGASIISPYDMWVAQGAQQMFWILGERFSEDELRRELAENP